LRIKALIISSLLLAGSARLFAGTMSFSGNFSADDDVVLIPFTVADSGSVLIQTTSFAASLGFEPVLTLYDGSGNLFLQDATGGTTPDGCGVRSIDPVSGFCLDAVIQNFLNAGNYTLALTEYDNIPGGPTLADGFPQTGNGNFTGPEFLGGPGSFILFNGDQRTSDWALDIDLPGPASPVPEPATLGLTGIGLLVAFFAARRKPGPVRSLSMN
jgi:hypothetical protein